MYSSEPVPPPVLDGEEEALPLPEAPGLAGFEIPRGFESHSFLFFLGSSTPNSLRAIFQVAYPEEHFRGTFTPVIFCMVVWSVRLHMSLRLLFELI